jgi:hypothetical protein
MYISSAGRIEMKVTETRRKRAEQRRALGVILRMKGAMKSADHQDKTLEEHPDQAGGPALIGSAGLRS